MLKLYNKLNNKKYIFEELFNNKTSLNIYTCGPTLYKKAHIGNYRVFYLIDYLICYTELINYKNKNKENNNKQLKLNIYSSITDFGHYNDFDINKIENEILSSNFKGHFIKYVSNYYEIFIRNLYNLLPNLQNNINFKAASNNKEYLNYLDNIYDKNYIELDQQNNYRIKKDILLEKLNNCIDSGKRLNQFCFFKKDEKGLYEWKGTKGNPGWHLECYLIMKEANILPVDIHIGGIDLLDIHNNAEIIHAELENNKISNIFSYVNHVKFNNNKISKSELSIKDNFINNIFNLYSPSAIKILMLNSDFIKEININKESLNKIEEILNNKTKDLAILSIICKEYLKDNSNIELFLKCKFMNIEWLTSNYDIVTNIANQLSFTSFNVDYYDYSSLFSFNNVNICQKLLKTKYNLIELLYINHFFKIGLEDICIKAIKKGNELLYYAEKQNNSTYNNYKIAINKEIYNLMVYDKIISDKEDKITLFNLNSQKYIISF